MDRGTRRAIVHGVAKSQTRLKWQHTHTAQCQHFWLFQLLFICYQDGSLQLCSDLCWDSVTRQRGEECRLSSPSCGILGFWDSVTSSFKKKFIWLCQVLAATHGIFILYCIIQDLLVAALGILFSCDMQDLGVSLVAQSVKNPPARQETGSGTSSGEGNGNPFQYSCLGDPMDRGA